MPGKVTDAFGRVALCVIRREKGQFFSLGGGGGGCVLVVLGGWCGAEVGSVAAVVFIERH